MQIRPLRPDLSLEGLQIQLVGQTTNAAIPVDAIGRAVLPMLKWAYDEDAVLRLNRQKGHYAFSGRYSIREQAAGIYPAAELRAACDQLLGAQRGSGYRFRLLGKKTAGVERALTVRETQPFENNTMGPYRVAVYRFADWPADGTVLAQSRPVALGTLYE